MNTMKHFLFPIAASLTMLVACENAQPEAVEETTAQTSGASVQTTLADGAYVINKVKPRVTWAATKLTGDGHDGTLHIESGKFRIQDGQISDGVVIFDMSRIEVTDLTGEDKASLEGHLRSGDFFNVETHPKAVLNVKGIETSGEQPILNATLTMNGEAVDYNIPVSVVEAPVLGNAKGLAIQGKFNLDRTKHNITYHSQTFNDKLDWFIRDEVSVGFSVIGVPTM